MARVSPEKTTAAAEAVLDRITEYAPTANTGESLEHMARAVALIAEHLKTDEPSERRGRSA